MEFLKKNATAIAWCIVEIVLGVLLIVHSESFIKVLAIIAGVIMIIGGVAFVVMYFVTHAREAEGKYLFNGLTYIALGIVLCVKYGILYAALDLIFVILAIVLLMAGFEKVQEVCDKIRLKQKKLLAPLIGAIVEIVLGILVLVLDETKWLFITIGILVIVGAVYNLCVLIFLNRASNAVKEAQDKQTNVIDVKDDDNGENS
ncbi:MAG: DUF308 domain-containing protein [Clostridia bacterium]|nr:DUF308 domain-containing protein [Clostridia bacterium]